MRIVSGVALGVDIRGRRLRGSSTTIKFKLTESELREHLKKIREKKSINVKLTDALLALVVPANMVAEPLLITVDHLIRNALMVALLMISLGTTLTTNHNIISVRLLLLADRTEELEHGTITIIDRFMRISSQV